MKQGTLFDLSGPRLPRSHRESIRPGIQQIDGRQGERIPVLAWSTGTRASERGEDLASIARTLTFGQLGSWLALFQSQGLSYEARVLLDESDRRKQIEEG